MFLLTLFGTLLFGSTISPKPVSSPPSHFPSMMNMTDPSVSIIASRLPPPVSHMDKFHWKSVVDMIDSQVKAVLEVVDSTTNWISESLYNNKQEPEKDLDDIYSIDCLLQTANEYVSTLSSDELWHYCSEKDDVKVWRMQNAGSILNLDKEASRWPCTKAQSIIDAPVDVIAELLMDSSRIQEVNRYSMGRQDISHMGPNTKVVWNRVSSSLAPKPHDFCSLMHQHRAADGSLLLITKAVTHPLVQPNSQHTRSEIIFSLNILRPIPSAVSSTATSTSRSSSRFQTQFTSISHVKYGNIHPYIASKGAFHGTVNFINNLKLATKQPMNSVSPPTSSHTLSPSLSRSITTKVVSKKEKKIEKSSMINYNQEKRERERREPTIVSEMKGYFS